MMETVKFVFENYDYVTTLIIFFIGCVTIAATLLGRVAHALLKLSDDSKYQGALGKIIDVLGRVSDSGLNILHLFPTFGTNPKTKLLKKKLDELEKTS